MTKAQQRALEGVLHRRFCVSQFDVPDSEMREAVQAAFDRWFDTWVGGPVRDVMRVERGQLSSRDLSDIHRPL